MFGSIVNAVVDITTDVVDTVTFGVVDKDSAKKLADAGLTVAQIAAKMDTTTSVVIELLDD